MYRLCTTEKTAAQQKQFTDALFLLMQKLPYSEISVTDLCRQTGLSRNIFYRLFDHKTDVLHALIDNFCVASVQATVSDTSQESIVSFYTFWSQNKAMLEILEKNRLINVFVSRSSNCYNYSDFGLPDDEYLLSFCFGAFMGLLMKWYQNGFDLSIEEIASITHRLIATPIEQV